MTDHRLFVPIIFLIVVLMAATTLLWFASKAHPQTLTEINKMDEK